MLTYLTIADQNYVADLRQPHDISIPLRFDGVGPSAWYAAYPRAQAVEQGDFVGSVARGGAVNFFTVHLNPHGNGTHTECVGHLTPERQSIHGALQQFHFVAQLVSVYPQRLDNGDRCILPAALQDSVLPQRATALIIRTLPNDDSKLTRDYSGTNPPYLAVETVTMLVAAGIEHLLLDLPSVDREKDDGQLAAHRAFWQYPAAVRSGATITEMVYVPNDLPDGYYLLSLQVPPFGLDAAPSRPCLYTLLPVQE